MQCAKVFYSDLSHSNYASSLQYYFITSSIKNMSVDIYGKCVCTCVCTYACVCVHVYNLQRDKDMMAFRSGKQINS